jgi:hypothetical protein
MIVVIAKRFVFFYFAKLLRLSVSCKPLASCVQLRGTEACVKSFDFFYFAKLLRLSVSCKSLASCCLYSFEGPKLMRGGNL